MARNPEDLFGRTVQDPNRVRTKWVDVKDPGLREVLGIPEGGMPLEDFLGFNKKPVEPVQQQATPGFFTSVKRGAAQSGQDLAQFASWASQASPVISDYFARKAEDLKMTAEALPRAVPAIEDIHSPGDFVTWGVETLGEQVPFIASLALPGGIVGGAARYAGAAASTAKTAGLTASFLTDAGLMTGESIDIAKQNNADPNDIRVVGSGLGKAVLDFIPFFTLAKTMGIAKPFENVLLKGLAEKGYLKRAAGNAAVLIASEVPTETLQEVINVGLDNYFTGYNGPLTEDQKSQLYNAAAGAALFGAFGLYAPKHAPMPGLTPKEQEDLTPKELKQLPHLPPENFAYEFSNVPTGGPGIDANGFDFRNLYDGKTGEVKTTAEDYLRILKEQMNVKYDALTDSVSTPPSTAKYTTIMPGWQQRGDSWYLDTPVNNQDAGRAQIAVDNGQYTAWDVYGNPLGTYPDLASAQIGAMNGVYAKGTKYLFDQDGMSVQGAPDGHTQFTSTFGEAATPIEQAAKAIEDAKPSKKKGKLRGPVTEEAVTAISTDAELMKLIDVRNEFINNKDNYRTTDGEMKNAAKQKLDALDARIGRYTQMKGVVNPNEGETVSVVGQKIDETLGKITNEEQKKAEAPKYPNLTAFEIKQYDDLVERDMMDGLSDKGYEELARLKAKMETGRDTYGEYRPATAEEVQGFTADENALLKKVQKHRKKYSKATREIMKMRGIQSAKNNFLGSVRHEEIFDLGELENELPGEKAQREQFRQQPMGWYAYDHEGDVIDGPFNSKELAQAALDDFYKEGSRMMQSKGFKEASGSEEKTWIDTTTNAGIVETKDGFEVIKTVGDETWSLGVFENAADAIDVAKGKTPAFVAEVQQALANLWKSFSIRPRLYVLSTADILSNKIRMTQDERQTLLESQGMFVEGRPGTIYIHIDQHDTVQQTVKTLVHEMIAHFGLRATLSKEHWTSVLWAYAQYNRDRIKELEAKGQSDSSLIARASNMEDFGDVLSADEAVAYFAQEAYTGDPLKPFEQKFLDRVVATVRSWFRWAVQKFLPKEWQRKVFEVVPFNDKDVIKILNDSTAILRNAQPNQDVNTRYSKRKIVQSAKAHETLTRSVDSFSDVWTAKAAGLFLQPLQFAERFNLPGVADYMKYVQRWAARKASLQNAPVELVEKWQNYSKNKASRLAEALLYLTGASDKKLKEGKGPLTEEERMQILKDHGVTDPEGIQLFNDIRKSFKQLLDQLENAIIKQTIRKEVTDPAYADRLYKAYLADLKDNTTTFSDQLTKNLKDLELGGRLMQVQSQINSLRQRDYFPYMRFGRYAIWVRAKQDLYLDGTKYKGPFEDKNGNSHAGQMVHFETFESYREMQEALKGLSKEYDGKIYDVGTGLVSDQEYTFLGMPPALYETLSEHLNLTEQQKEQLKEIYFTKSPGQRFLRNMINRKGIRGFSQDAIRVYASYMLNAAGHIARIENGQDMDASVAQIRKYAQDNGIVAGEVRDYWGKHYSYIMNPENDWAGIRAAGFMWYLGFNVKSAMVNLTQVPMVAYPFLSARFGDARALSALTQAYKDTFKILQNRDIPKTQLEKAIQRGIEEGFLDESLATVLAGFAESSVLQRIAPETDAQRRLNQIAWAGSWMFRHVEKINRYVTFIAARKLALERNNGNEEQAFEEAKEAVQSSMFEYAKWNRASFARGKKSVFFLFWSYMQGLAYLMGGGKGKKTALRVWMMMLIAAGYQGIPFADNILDLFDWGSREVKEALGLKDPYTDLRTDMQKFAQSITDNPDLLLHGWSKHYGLGPVHLLKLAGVPVPEVDLSGSLGVGRWLPGTDKITSTEPDPDKKFGQTLVDVLGPVAGMGYGFFRVLTDDNPDRWKTWERAMPNVLKAVSQGSRRMVSGSEEFRGGGSIAEWDPTNPEDRLGLAMNMLGFQPTKVSNAYQVIGAKENLKRYWSSRQAIVMENYAFAKRSGDPELMADAKEALERFNESVPDPMLRMNNEKIRRSMKARQKKIMQRESGIPGEKGYRRLYQEIDQIYEKR